MGEDKNQAITESERIRERTLHELALIGGFLGIIIGGCLFHHKTRKTRFWLPVALSVGVWGALFFLVA